MHYGPDLVLGLGSGLFGSCCLRPRGHLLMIVCVTRLTPKLMPKPHRPAQGIEFTVADADAAASVESAAVALQLAAHSAEHQLQLCC